LLREARHTVDHVHPKVEAVEVVEQMANAMMNAAAPRTAAINDRITAARLRVPAEGGSR
jgi:hypothetical protein